MAALTPPTMDGAETAFLGGGGCGGHLCLDDGGGGGGGGGGGCGGHLCLGFICGAVLIMVWLRGTLGRPFSIVRLGGSHGEPIIDFQ